MRCPQIMEAPTNATWLKIKIKMINATKQDCQKEALEKEKNKKKNQKVFFSLLSTNPKFKGIL